MTLFTRAAKPATPQPQPQPCESPQRCEPQPLLTEPRTPRVADAVVFHERFVAGVSRISSRPEGDVTYGWRCYPALVISVRDPGGPGARLALTIFTDQRNRLVEHRANVPFAGERAPAGEASHEYYWAWPGSTPG